MINKIKNTENKDELSKHLITAIEVLLAIVMRTNNQTFILEHLRKLYMLPISETLNETDNARLMKNLEDSCQELL